MGRPTKIGDTNILSAAEDVLKTSGAASFTLDSVASAAGCAKGLVHYHFGSRTQLLIAANDRLWDRREDDWAKALRAGAPEDCIRQSWTLLAAEASSGITRAWLSLLTEPDRALGQAVRRRMERFDTAMRGATTALLDNLGLEPTIPPDEWSRLVVASAYGLGLQLVARGKTPALEADYSAIWLSALGLTRPKP